jgi:hypothetical protein
MSRVALYLFHKQLVFSLCPPPGGELESPCRRLGVDLARLLTEGRCSPMAAPQR